MAEKSRELYGQRLAAAGYRPTSTEPISRIYVGGGYGVQVSSLG